MGVQPEACGLPTAQDGCEWSLTQNHKFTHNIMRFWGGLLVFVYWMCGPRQPFFFQCGPEKPKVWTPLIPDPQQQNAYIVKYLLKNY